MWRTIRRVFCSCMLLCALSGTSGAQRTPLVPLSGISDGDFYGTDVAIDGNWAIVGAPGVGFFKGAAYVYERVGPGWEERGVLVGDDPTSFDSFGEAVAIEGDRAVVASLGEDDEGALYVYERSGTVWVRVAKLRGSGAVPGSSLGFSVSLFQDRIIASARRGSDARITLYVFERSDQGGWEETAVVGEPTDVTGSRFTEVLAQSGPWLAVGSPFGNPSTGSRTGSVYLFERVDGAWAFDRLLVSPDPSGSDRFGRSVALLGDALAVGADASGDLQGAVYTFDLVGGEWEAGEIVQVPQLPQGANFGRAVSLSDSRLVVGATRGENESGRSGAAYVFDSSADGWTASAKLVPAEASSDAMFGNAVAVSGENVVVGAVGDGARDAGAAYAFTVLVPTGAEATWPGDAMEVSAVWPNPTTGAASVRVHTAAPQRLRVSVVDALGRELVVTEALAASSASEVPLDLSALPPGVYSVRVVGEGFESARPLTVVR